MERTSVKRPRPSPKAILRGHTQALTTLTFFHNHLLSGDESGTIRLWDVNHEALILSHHSSSRAPVQSIAVNPASLSSILVQYKTGVVTELDLEHDASAVDLESWKVSSTHGRVLLDDKGNVANENTLCESFCAIQFVAPNVWVGPGGDSDAVVVMDSREACSTMALLSDPSRPSNKRAGMLMSLCSFPGAPPSESSQRVLAGYEDGSVSLWDLRNPALEVSSTKAGSDTIICISASPRGRVAITGGGFSYLAGIAETERGLETVAKPNLREQGVSSVAWDDSGKVAVSAGWDGRVRVWNGKRTKERFLKPVTSLRWHDDKCTAVAIDGEVLATAGKDKTIALWDSHF